jgi:hypothetical protein
MGITVKTVSEVQALEVRATLDEIGISMIDNHFADIRKYGAFAIECLCNWRPVADTQQFQPSEVG